MRKLPYLARLILPSLVLGFLTYYAEVVDGSGQVPLAMNMVVALLLGYFFPKGSWRWVILIGIGVELSLTTGHLIDSTAVTREYQITIQHLAWGLLPALIGVYSGIFVRRYFLGVSDTTEENRQNQLSNIERDLQALSLAIEAKKKLDNEKNDAVLVDTNNEIGSATTSEVNPPVENREEHLDDTSEQQEAIEDITYADKNYSESPDLFDDSGNTENLQPQYRTKAETTIPPQPEHAVDQKRGEALKRLESKLGLK